jgi:hypothetical protein
MPSTAINRVDVWNSFDDGIAPNSEAFTGDPASFPSQRCRLCQSNSSFDIVGPF